MSIEAFSGTPGPLRFASFELDVRSRELRLGGRRVRLQEQPFEILRLMLERPGEVVTRDELRRRLWPEGTFVDFEHSLNAAVKRLRAALGDDADRPRFVETLPRRGYRFIAALEPCASMRGSVPVEAAPRTRLVVLPFSNLSDDSRQEYFSDGLTEELIGQLGPILRGHVGVIARWSSMAFKGSIQRASEIGEALRADYILEGSVRRDGDRVRITARLVEASGEAHLWSETYERTVSDWLAVQADVAGRVARSLVKELVLEPRQVTPPDVDPAAYQAYLKGRYHWARPGDIGLGEAVAYLEEAARIAPSFAAAFSALARVRVACAQYYHTVPRLALTAAREAASRALDLDPAASDPHGVIAEVRRTLDWDWDASDSAYLRAMALNPSNESAPRLYGVALSIRGRHAEALAQVDRACELDPLCLEANAAAAWVRYAAGDFEAAIGLARHTLGMDPDFGRALLVLGAALLQSGRRAEAISQLELAAAPEASHPVALCWLAHAKAVGGDRAGAEALVARVRRVASSRYVPAYHLALAYAGLGAFDAAFAALDDAYLDRDPSLGCVTIDPRFAPLRTDSRYDELLQRLNLGAGMRLAG